MSTDGVIETFGNRLLQDVEFNNDGTLKTTGKQNVKFYNKKRQSFRAKIFEDGKIRIDPKSGLPVKEYFEENVVMLRVETRGDTNIKDDIADEFSKRQFYGQYKHFRDGKVPDGNPIEDFEFLQPSTIMELHLMGIHVIQQAAVMSDLECERLIDQSGFEVRDIAASWVRINSPQGQSLKAAQLENKILELERQLEDAKLGNGGSSKPEKIAWPLKAEEASAEPPSATIEIPVEEFAQKRRGRPRKVI